MRRLALVCVLLLPACLQPGDRGSTCSPYDTSCQTTCPVGETCSPDTPSGLYFGGAMTSDPWLSVSRGPMITARGGTQTILISGLGALPFEADSDGGAFSVVSTGSDTVVIRGEAAGGANLRIVDPRSGQLYDRIGLNVAEATGARFTFFDTLENATPTVLWGAGGLEAVIALDGDGGRLADESMSFALPPSGAAETYLWDAFTIADPLPQPFSMGVTLGDGTPLTATMPVAYDADQVAYLPILDPSPPSGGIETGTGNVFPFRASAGGHVIAGATFVAQASGALAVQEVTGNVVGLDGLQPGTGHLIVSVGTAAVDYDVPVHAPPSTAAPTPHPLAAPHASPAPGERAQLAAD
jgi:hypothetical protein